MTLKTGNACSTVTRKQLEDWVWDALRFIDLCQADAIDYADRDLDKDATRLIKAGYELYGAGDDCSLADLKLMDLRAPLAPTGVTDELVARGVAGIQARDAQGWGDEDEAQINRELARAVLQAVLTGDRQEPAETVDDVLLRIVPAGHHCGPIEATAAQFADLEAAIAREEAARAAKMPTDQAAIDQLNEAVRRLQDLGWKEAIHCPKDGSEFDGIEPGSTGIHTYLYIGKWPDGGFWCSADGDLWPSRPILFRPRQPAVQPDPRWTLSNGKPWTRDDSTTFNVLGLVGEIELDIPTRPEHEGTIFARLNEGRNVRRLTVEDIAAWSDDQVRDGELWAGAIHLSASDNDDVEIPPTPEHLKPWLERKA